MKKLFRPAYFVVLFLLLGNTLFAQSEKALLWKITGKGLREPSYLFGTYHLLTHKFLTTTPEIKEPFKQAKGVVVEMVIDSSRLQQLGMMALMPDQKISSLISVEEFNLVSAELEKLMGVSLTQLDQFKPVSIMVMMTLVYAQQRNAEILAKYPGLPMDYFYAATGKMYKKEVTPLETQEEQIDLLYNSFSIEEQARQLVKYVAQKELAAQTQADLLALYLDKDLRGMYALTESLPTDLGNSDALLKDRNTKWMEVLPKLMKKQSQFIAVGALHLPGPDGLIALLRKQGFTVTPVK
ncbi:MAG: TraB/GumN family protein [Cytophagales bacterium]|nr:TraB/GumN family protein [Cytophagales bacterium]